MKKMNLPNKLTVLRVVLIPLFMLFMLCFEIGPRLHTILAMAVFIIASLTDMLDGKIAREQNLVTNFGKFLDPLADKLLVMVALISFTFERWIDPVAVVIILAREFMVTGLRLVVANEGIVVAAGIWGKLKTAFTMVAMCIIMFLQILFPELKGAPDLNWVNPVFIINEVLIWISVILTVISGGIYLKAYGKYIDPNE
ncbi:MAG: CDP-diacylglycerol--glycerol-3-phosphate 3-phosphatidyltransferase [Ruminococcus sp.]|nr:CDP-diacylglycerol--glycerol-3-phosphate 3-phosphatidyltransferase [Ruminococcus sp.]MBP3797611.1 CDP-diacylglycerol--glycerol-3-phosphate 3-phosphatidyltransferase [Ruminococcus sp.]MBQ1433300.1 CDP-diacylglycerol--glycerol-3-phosphate 3-phosphatidyltransferase [Ruminococcus sp.]